MTNENTTNSEEKKQSQSNTANQSLPQPMPPRQKVSFQKKRDFGSYQNLSRNDYRGFMTSRDDPQHQNYVPTKTTNKNINANVNTNANTKPSNQSSLMFAPPQISKG